MTDQVAEPTEGASPDGQAIAEAVAEPKATTPEEIEATWRKRQAGADAAKAVAERERDELKTRLAKYEQAENEAKLKDMTAEARLQAELAEAKRRADEAEAAAEAKVLNKLYPKAREKFPEIRDESRLAELEALYAEPAAGAEPADARSMRAPKTPSASSPKEETSADIEARLAKMPNPFARSEGFLSRN